MKIKTTERRHKSSGGIDALSTFHAAEILLQGQVAAVQAVSQALPTIEKAAVALLKSVQCDGKLVYCAAGSSGLMALADALELPGTYGISSEQIKILLAGGHDGLKHMLGAPEDNEDLAIRDLASADLSAIDTVIVLSASGSTPYAVKSLEFAKEAGATTVSIANNEDTPLLNLADIAVFLPTPPEVIAGSTRMGAASAQKVALNIMSTLMAIGLGHVHDGYMVNMVADNEKLRARARAIVVDIAECDTEAAADALKISDGNIKLAVLFASGAEDAEAANILLKGNGQKLRPSLSALKQSLGSKTEGA